jgi:hypothetical protein
LMSCFPVLLVRYFLNDFEVVPVAPIITGITLFLHPTYAVFLLLDFYILKIFSLSSIHEFSVSVSGHTYFFIIMDYDVLFILQYG